MAQVEYIKHLYENEDKSLREIAKITNLSFQTVQKYAYMDDWNADSLPDVAPERHPKLGEFIPIIDHWLEQDLKQPRKQRHTIIMIHRRLTDEHGFTGSYSTVKRYVRKKKYLLHQDQKGYLPLAKPLAHAQLDFGSFKYYNLLDKQETGYALIMTFPYSNKGYAQVFKGQNQECLLEGMKRIFNHIGGVPISIKTDNMSTAVRKVHKGKKRDITDGFRRFMLHHRFRADFCNPAAGNEKGSVENKVGYIRRNFLVPIPKIENFDVFNKELMAKCEKDGERKHYKLNTLINDLFKEEQEKLLTLPPHDYDVFHTDMCMINKYGHGVVDTNNYAINPELNGQLVLAKIYYDRIEFYYKHSLLKTYPRSYKSGEDVEDWKQYVPTMLRKPGSIEHTRFFDQLPKHWQHHLVSIKDKERKSALLILMEMVENNHTSLCNRVIEMANDYGRLDNDTIKHCYYKLIEKDQVLPELVLKQDVVTLNYTPDLTSYDKLSALGGNADERLH